MTTAVEPLYVTDTNALYWHLTGDRKLSRNAIAIFEAAKRGETQIVVSAIVLAEFYYLNRKWNTFPDFAKVYQEITTRPEFLLVPFMPDAVLEFDSDSAVPEMHDRIIAGLARRLGAPLITSDAVILASGVVKVVW